jgi:hypothetical protein
MAKLAIGAAFGILVGVIAGAACGLHAEGTEPDEETIAAANDARVDLYDLLGAVNTTGLGPREYLIAVGELAPLISTAPSVAPEANPQGWPFGGPIAQRIYCVESIESRHGAAMYNPTPVWNGEHAQGWLGYLPSTALRWGVQIGSRASEWSGAARIFSQGEAFARTQFAGVGQGRC